MADKTIKDNRQEPYETLGIERRAKEQVERYRERGLDVDDFEFMPFENGSVFHADNETPPNRYQAWLQRNESGEWDVVYLDGDSVRYVYERQALPVLEAERQADLRPETDGVLAWYPNRSGDDNREVPEIQSFWMLKDNDGKIWGCNNEHLQLIGPDGQVIEAQDDMYPPHIFDLQSGRLANGFSLRVNPENPPENMPEGLTNDDGTVNQMAADMFLGFKTPNPAEPGAFVRFKPAEEGFAIGYVQTNGQDPALAEAARVVASGAAFTPDEMEFISVPEEQLNIVKVDPPAVAEVSVPDYGPVDEGMSAPVAVEPAAGANSPAYDREAHSTALDDFRNMVRERHAEQAADAAETAAPSVVATPVETVIDQPDTPAEVVAPPSEQELLIDRLNMYLDIAEPPGADTMRSLLNGEFGEPSALDMAFVAESLYAHVLQVSNENDNFAPAMMRVYSDLRVDINGLRQAAGYVPHGQSDTVEFQGQPSTYPGLGEPVVVSNEGGVVTYSQVILDAAPGIMPVAEMVDFTSLKNNPVAANALKAELGLEPAPAPAMAEPAAEVPEIAAGSQLEAYIDIIEPDDAEALKALLGGEFGEPTATDLAFVAENIYMHIVNQTSDAGYQGSPDQLQVLENLKTELPVLRDAAGYSSQDFEYVFEIPAAIGYPRPSPILERDLIGNTSFMNDPEFAAAFTAHQSYHNQFVERATSGNPIPTNEINMDLMRQPELPIEHSGATMAPQSAPVSLDHAHAPDFSIQYEYRYPSGQSMILEAEHEKEHYFDFADGLVDDVVAQEGGREALIADFLENNDPSVFPLKPVMNDDGNNIMTMQLGGQTTTFWVDANGDEISLGTEQLGALIERVIDTDSGVEGLQNFLAEHPELESALQIMAMTIDTIQEVEQGRLAPDINYDAPDPNEGVSPRELNEIMMRVSP